MLICIQTLISQKNSLIVAPRARAVSRPEEWFLRLNTVVTPRVSMQYIHITQSKYSLHLPYPADDAIPDCAEGVKQGLRAAHFNLVS
jgi:hypothetical protein